MTAPQRPPRDNLVRAMFPGPELRDDEEGIGTLSGEFAVFNQWARIDSAIEGTFMERIAPGAFRKTFAEQRDNMKVLFQHGQDPQVGNKPLGPIRSLEETETGARYEVPLLDTSYNRDLLPGLKAGLYGASFRFSVLKEDFNAKPPRSDHNPEGLPERTIREMKVPEFGPVTFPAYVGASAAVRSLTDSYVRDLLTTLPEEPAPATPAPESRVEAPIEAPTPSERTAPVTDEYQSPADKAARATEIKQEMTRLAQEFTGVMPIEQQARWDADKVELAKLEADMAAHASRQAFLGSIHEEPTKTEGPVEFNYVKRHTADDIYNVDQFSGIRYRSAEERNQTLRDNALRSLESSYVAEGTKPEGLARWLDTKDIPATDASPEFSGIPEIAARVLVTGSPVYKRAFAKYLRHGNSNLFTPEEQRAAALAVVGTTTTGGYAVPYVFDPTIINIGAFTAQNPYRQACRVESISGGNNWRAVTVGAVTTLYVAEAAAATEQGPTFGQPTYTVQRAHAFATVSIETLQDRPDIGAELTSVFAESKATYEENQFTLGIGTGVFPQGMFLTTAFTAVTTATNDVTAIGDLNLVEAALPLRFRAVANWFMNRSTIRQLQVMDTTNRIFSGAGIQYPGSANPNFPVVPGNTGLAALGYPIWEVPSAVSTLTTDAATIAVLCDPKMFVIVDRLGMTVEVIPNMLNGATPSFPTGERGIYAYFRNTARPLIADGGRQLKVQ